MPLSPDQKAQIEEWTNLFSSKSIRKGRFNEIFIHSIISIFQACARTGHFKGINIDSYLNSFNPLKGFPGTYALHGNKQIRMKFVLPDICMIVSMNQAAVERFIRFFWAPLLSKSLRKDNHCGLY